MMINALSFYTNMEEALFLKRLEQLDWQLLAKDPEKALAKAQISLKSGISLQLVVDESEAQSMPANVLPIIRAREGKKALPLDKLEKVAGGVRRLTGKPHQ